MKCTLESDINNCPFYKKETLECNKEKDCSFQEKDITKPSMEFVRKEKSISRKRF